MAKRLEGQVAIITGGARGIGEATAKLFVKHGAMVVIADIEDTIGTELANSLSPSATFVHCDLRKEEDIRNLIDKTMLTFGRLDILFNNAGVLGNQSKDKMSIMDFNANEFDHVIGINVRGAALATKHAARIMAPRRRGSIICTSSVAGVMGGLGPYAYTASKHAIIGLTKNAACELGKYGIRVNCVSPFGVATSMLVNGWRNYDENGENKECNKCYMDKFGTPSPPSEKEVEAMEKFVRGVGNLKGATLRANDIAEAALYLASDESKYVSGHNLVVDGGVTTANNYCLGLF